MVVGTDAGVGGQGVSDRNPRISHNKVTGGGRGGTRKKNLSIMQRTFNSSVSCGVDRAAAKTLSVLTLLPSALVSTSPYCPPPHTHRLLEEDTRRSIAGPPA